MPGSSLRYAPGLAGPRREVYFSGDAFFKVSKNPRRPFLVYAPQVVTTVLGTSFRVRALAGSPGLILADEPTAALDKQSGQEVVHLMRDLARGQGVPILLVTHDPRILDIADRIVAMEDGRITDAALHA